MIGRLSVFAIGLACGLLLAFLLACGLSPFQQPSVSFGQSQEATSVPERDTGARSREQGVAKLSSSAIEGAGIAVAEVKSGTIARRIIVPGTIVPGGPHCACGGK